MKFKIWACAIAALCVPCLPVAAAEAGYPDKPVRLIVASPPAGAGDYFARAISVGLGKKLGQSIIIDNRGGASGTIGATAVATAPADGYTILMGQSTGMVVAPHILPKLGYNTLTDLKPISLVASQPMVLVVNPKLPVHDLKEFIAYAKAHPGELNYGSSGSGSPSHLAGVLFDAAAGIQTVHVAYKGGAPAMNALMGGEIQFQFAPIVAVMTQVEAGRLRALAVTSAEPTPAAAHVPTIAAAGGPPHFALSAWFALFAPAQTPPAIVQRLYQETLAVLQEPEMKARFLKEGADAIGSTPEECDRFVRAEYARYAKLVKDANIKGD
ncbi:MAG: tripartite tricarboxylate transporter substrate binding protein [Pseudomonadota bacterium]